MVLSLLIFVPVNAFPPAPPFVIYGTVRDEMGNPLILQGATVIFETPSSAPITASVFPGLEPGVNYRMTVPMDSGVTVDKYRSNMANAGAPFLLRVRIGQTDYLPIEMSGDFATLGEPAQSRRLDLTLGEDRDGDGLPDAWERALAAASQGALGEIDPNGDSDNDGLTNLEEYLAGTFAYDANNGFSMKIVEVRAEDMSLEFMSVRGRSYQVFVSSDLNEWNEAPFRLEGDSVTDSKRFSYLAETSAVVRVKMDTEDDRFVPRFFKLRVE